MKPVPFVTGFVLTYAQIELLANATLPQDYLSQSKKYGQDHCWALNGYLLDHSRPQAVLPFPNANPASEKEYLYVVGVLPSFNGKPPKPPITADAVRRLKLLLPEETRASFGKVYSGTMRWPRYCYEPEWLETQMYSVIQRMREASKLKGTNDASESLVPV